MTKEYEIGDADHALDRNQQFGLLRGNGHIEGGPAELDDTADPPTVTAPTPWSVYVDGETVDIDGENNTVELPQPHPTLDRWDVIYVDPDGALQVESGEPAEVIGERGLQAREPAPPSFAEIDGVVVAAAYRQFDEADGAAFSLSELFYDRRVRTLADVESLAVKNADAENLAVSNAPETDTDAVRKLEADELQDNIDSLDTAFTDHSARHENNGEDELNVEGLSGDLADRQDPKDHQERHHEGGPDEITEGSLTRQNPTEHAVDHAAGERDSLDAATLSGASGVEGQFLRTDGTAASWQDVPEGALTQTFETSGTFEKPDGIEFVLVECVGGGGGGGGAENGGSSRDAGGGGGGGVYRSQVIEADKIDATVEYTVGAGGEGGTSSNGYDGLDGGETEFLWVTANGGNGGGSEENHDTAFGGDGASYVEGVTQSQSLFVGGGLGSTEDDAEPGIRGGGGGGRGDSDGTSGGSSVFSCGAGGGATTNSQGGGSGGGVGFFGVGGGGSGAIEPDDPAEDGGSVGLLGEGGGGGNCEFDTPTDSASLDGGDGGDYGGGGGGAASLTDGDGDQTGGDGADGVVRITTW